MFDVSRNVLVVLAVIAIALFILGIATDVGLFGWVLAIIVGAYVITAFMRMRRAA
jgi:hypothetical protein